MIVGVAAAQFYQVYFTHLTRWKGGGFGMYSEVHPKFRQVWLIKEDTSIRLFNMYKQPEKLVKSAHRLKFAPSPQKMQKMAKEAANHYNINLLTVQVWEPYIKPETNVLSMKLIGEEIYEKAQ